MRTILLFFLFFPITWLSMAQCPTSKYGVAPVFPIHWSETEQDNWFQTMRDHGMGLLTETNNWRLLQEMVDSNKLGQLRSEVEQIKLQYGFDKYLFTFQNPARFSNFAPPVYCGNPLTDTNTTKAMFRFITVFIDTMHTVMDYFVMGSETDIYFKARPAERDSFMVLAEKVSTYIDTYHPEIKFGIGVSVQNGIQQDQTVLNMAKPFSDIVAVTYWPIASDYSVNAADIDSVQRDINDILLAADTFPVIIRECGLPTSANLGSSENLQAEFVRQSFMQTLYLNQIEAVGFSYLSDFDTTQIYWQQNFNLTYASEFYYYISSLGLMDSLGNAKAGWPEYLAMLDTACVHSRLTEVEKNPSFSVYPNPCGENLFVKTENIYKPVDYQLFDLQGKLILSGSIGSENSFEINVSDCPAGSYLLRISSIGKEPEQHIVLKLPTP